MPIFDTEGEILLLSKNGKHFFLMSRRYTTTKYECVLRVIVLTLRLYGVKQRYQTDQQDRGHELWRHDDGR